MFDDRIDAGERLGEAVRERLARLGASGAPVVVGLPRGGVPVAVEVARAIGAPVDVILVRKLGVPWHRELAMGAVGEDGAIAVNDDVMRSHHVDPDEFALVVDAERRELERRSRRLRGSRRSHPLGGRLVVVVDDGMATGATARAACHVARRRGAARVVLAVPVAPHGWESDLADTADDYIALETPSDFCAVGAYYRDFRAVSDDEVVDLLALADAEDPTP